MKIHLLYHLKNMLLRTPFSYGHYRRLRKYRDRSYNLERDKHPLRDKHQAKEGWKIERSEGVHYRDYSSYEEYLTHQVQKYSDILKLYGGFNNQAVRDFRDNFYRRFRHLSDYLHGSAMILCLGARQGTEVEVLRDLGYKQAIGLDLNPGPDNPYVRHGDFMALEYPNESVDMVYTNCVDHAFDLDKFFKEHLRVLKPGGYAMYDVAELAAGGGAFEAVEWESEEVILLLALKYYRKVIKIQKDGTWKWMLFQK